MYTLRCVHLTILTILIIGMNACPKPEDDGSKRDPPRGDWLLHEIWEGMDGVGNSRLADFNGNGAADDYYIHISSETYVEYIRSYEDEALPTIRESTCQITETSILIQYADQTHTNTLAWSMLGDQLVLSGDSTGNWEPDLRLTLEPYTGDLPPAGW